MNHLLDNYHTSFSGCHWRVDNFFCIYMYSVCNLFLFCSGGMGGIYVSQTSLVPSKSQLSSLYENKVLSYLIWLFCFQGYGYWGPFLEWWGEYHKPEDIKVWIQKQLVPVLQLKPCTYNDRFTCCRMFDCLSFGSFFSLDHCSFIFCLFSFCLHVTLSFYV